MDLAPALIATLALIALALGAGRLWRSRTGRVRRSAPAHVDLLTLLAHANSVAPTSGAAGSSPSPGERATLVQFSADLCSSCGPARRVLSQFAQAHPGLVHAEINLTAHPELAGELRLLSTPTTVIFDSDGHQRGRIAGAPRKSELAKNLSDLLESGDAVNA